MPNYTFRLPGSKGVNVSDTPADTEVLTFDAASDQYVSSAGGGGGHTIQEEGVGLTARTNLNFIGAGVTATDNAGTNSTDVTVTTGTPPFADTNSIVEGGTDATKELRIEVDGLTALTTRVWTAPDADLTVVGTITTQTLQNKSVDADANTITNIENADIKAAAAIAVNKLAALTASRAVASDGSGFLTVLSATGLVSTITFIIDGGGSAITTGVKGFLEIPFACTITQATTLADQTGSIVIDIWKDTYANYPPTVADTITAAAKPTISTSNKAQDSTLTGWTTSITAGDILGFNVDSITTVTRVTISLKVTKT